MLQVGRSTMKLVLLELIIVVVATRAVMSLLLGRPPAWPTPAWGIAMLAVAGALVAALIAGEVRRRRRESAAPPARVPSIPLERIGPFTPEAMLVRYGARGPHDINLN